MFAACSAGANSMLQMLWIDFGHFRHAPPVRRSERSETVRPASATVQATHGQQCRRNTPETDRAHKWRRRFKLRVDDVRLWDEASIASSCRGVDYLCAHRLRDGCERYRHSFVGVFRVLGKKKIELHYRAVKAGVGGPSRFGSFGRGCGFGRSAVAG